MKNIITLFRAPILIGVTLLTPIQASSGDVDYLSYMDRVDQLTELVVSAKSCESAGMTIDWKSLEKVTDELKVDAIKNGIDFETFAQPVILDALRKKRENEDYLFKYYKENPDKIDEYTDHWAERCHKLATEEITKKYIYLKK